MIIASDNSIHENCSEAADFYEIYGHVSLQTISRALWADDEEDQIVSFMDHCLNSQAPVVRRFGGSILHAVMASESFRASVQSAQAAKLDKLAADHCPAVSARYLEITAATISRLSLDQVKSSLWPLIQMVWQTHGPAACEEEALAKAAGLKCVAAIRHALDGRIAKSVAPSLEHIELEVHSVLKTILQFVNEAKLDDIWYNTATGTQLVLNAVATHFDQLFGGLSNDDAHLSPWHIARAFLQLSTSRLVLIRQHCAKNLAAVCLTVRSHPEAASTIIETFESLATDTQEQVRLAAVRSVDAVTKALASPLQLMKLQDVICKLLLDGSSEVRILMMKSLNDATRTLEAHDNNSDYVSVKKILQSAVKATDRASNEIKKEFTVQVRKLTSKFSDTTGCTVAFPALQRLAFDGSFIVRQEAAKAIIWMAKKSNSALMRDHYLSWLVNDLAADKSRLRCLLVESSVTAVQVLPEAVFVKYFSKPVLILFQDPLTNVRICLARALSKLCAVCCELSIFNQALSGLARDPDEDVRNAMEPSVLSWHFGRASSPEIIEDEISSTDDNDFICAPEHDELEEICLDASTDECDADNMEADATLLDGNECSFCDCIYSLDGHESGMMKGCIADSILLSYESIFFEILNPEKRHSSKEAMESVVAKLGEEDCNAKSEAHQNDTSLNTWPSAAFVSSNKSSSHHDSISSSVSIDEESPKDEPRAMICDKYTESDQMVDLSISFVRSDTMNCRSLDEDFVNSSDKYGENAINEESLHEHQDMATCPSSEKLRKQVCSTQERRPWRDGFKRVLSGVRFTGRRRQRSTPNSTDSPAGHRIERDLVESRTGSREEKGPPSPSRTAAREVKSVLKRWLSGSRRKGARDSSTGKNIKVPSDSARNVDTSSSHSVSRFAGKRPWTPDGSQPNVTRYPDKIATE